MRDIRRREFILALGGTLTARSLSARAQQSCIRHSADGAPQHGYATRPKCVDPAK